jgi:CO/xanthine dehydrogenase FAD-binding subunit
MSTLNESYLRPRSLDEAVSQLAGGGAEVLGGGTYLIGRGARRAARLVDLDRLELDYVTEDEAGLRCGAMVRLQELVESDPLKRFGEGVLSEAARATRQSWMLRNMSSVGGEVVARSRHSALAVALLALDAELTLATVGGVRRLALQEFYRDGGAGIGAPFILVEVFVPRPARGARAAFRRLAQLPSQEALAGAAVSLSIEGSRVRRARAALVSSTAAPLRLTALEQSLEEGGAHIGDRRLRDCCEAGLAGVDFTGDLYRSPAYLREMSELLLFKTCRELLGAGEA